MKDHFGPESHKHYFPTHSNKDGHYCNDFDGLWVCEDCEEFHVCGCVEKTPEQKAKDEQWNKELKEFNERNPFNL